MVKFIVILLVLGMVLHSQAYQMTKCQLLKALRKQGFPENQLKDWMCLIEYESGRRTHLTGPVNSNGSRDHGLFQINDKWWCSNSSTPGKSCNVTCADVKKDDITKASACAKKIYKAQGFAAWYAWKNHCKGKLPALPSC